MRAQKAYEASWAFVRLRRLRMLHNAFKQPISTERPRGLYNALQGVIRLMRLIRLYKALTAVQVLADISPTRQCAGRAVCCASVLTDVRYTRKHKCLGLGSSGHEDGLPLPDLHTL